MLLTAVALLFHLKPTSRDGAWRSSLLLCSGLAGGAALGTKYTLIPAVGALTVTLVLAARRGSRWRTAGFWLLGVAITGSYWYLRNLLVVGNPLPSVRLGIGPLHLPEVPFAGSQKLIDYLFDGRAWHRFFLPGLRDAFGPLWWALFALAFTGFVAGVILARDRLVKMVAVVGATAFVAYIVGPQILGYGSYLFQFAVNVRYAAPAIVLGLMALPIAARQLGRRATLVVLVAYAVMFVATQFDPTIWGNRRVLIASPTSGAWPRVFGIVFGVVVLVAALVLRQQPDWWHAIVSPRLTTVGVIAVVLVVFGGYFLQESYQRNRYTESPLFPTISQWARETQDARIAVVGTNSQYPLYGRDLSNYVQYVARRGADHQSSRFATCRSWRRALNAGRYDYLVATSPGYPFPTKSRALEIEWTRSDPAARVLSQTSSDRAQIVLFKLDGRMHPDACT
jgi:hypothetical protein